MPRVNWRPLLDHSTHVTNQNAPKTLQRAISIVSRLVGFGRLQASTPIKPSGQLRNFSQTCTRVPQRWHIYGNSDLLSGFHLNPRLHNIRLRNQPIERAEYKMTDLISAQWGIGTFPHKNSAESFAYRLQEAFRRLPRRPIVVRPLSVRRTPRFDGSKPSSKTASRPGDSPPVLVRV